MPIMGRSIFEKSWSAERRDLPCGSEIPEPPNTRVALEEALQSR
jgi:hypothetical protein